nr:unnamed protein product [Callosobruchus analis]
MDRNEVVSSNTKSTQSCIVLDPKPQQVQIILQSFVNFLQKANNVKESRSVSVNSVPMISYQPSNSSMNYLSYRKNVNERMSEISNNVSQMIIESCTSIDNICNKVRECLTDMHFNTGKINSISEISQYGMKEVPSSFNMDACMKLDKLNSKNNEDNAISQSEVSVIESVHDDFSQSLSLNTSEQRRLLTPFFTIIQEGSSIALQKTSSKRQMLRAKNKLSLAKLNRQMHKKTDILDAFKSALISNADIDEYEVMDRVVEDMNQEIARLSSTLIDMKKLTATRVKIETKTMADRERKVAITAVAPVKKTEGSTKKGEASTTLAAVPYVESNPSLTEAIPESEKTKLSESIAQLVPDVYRRPAVTDLHIKLLVQIEANDSYICFQRLMSRDCRGKLRRRKSQLRHLLLTEGQLPGSFLDTSPAPLPAQKTISNSSSICSTSAPSVKDLKKKYADSLWFSDKQIVKKPHDKRLHKPRRHTSSAGSQASLASTLMKFSSKSKLSRTGLPLPDRSSLANVRRSKCQMAVNKPSSVPEKRTAEGKKSKSLVSKSLLDSGIASKHQVRVINDAPPSPSTKYKMQCMRARNMLSPNRHLGYLDILDDLTEKDLLPLKSEYPRRDNITEEVEVRDVEDTYLYKILHGKYNSKTTWSHLIEPGVECSDENCQMCGPANGKRQLRPKNGVEELLPAVWEQNKLSKEQIAKKLLPYMTDPSDPAAAARNFRTVTVLPVHVTYDKHQVPVVKAEQPTKMASAAAAFTKLPLLPMKEPRMHTVRGNWTQPQQQNAGGPIQHQHRPMKVVYDGISKNPLPSAATPLPNPPLPPPPTTNVSINLTTKMYSNSARCKDEKKLATGVQQKVSRSFSPRGFSNYCSIQDHSQISAVKRPSSQSGKNEPVKQTPEKSSPKQQPPKKLSYVPEKRLPRNSIYGKTVQQQLVNFVERQTEVYSVPRPKYAQPLTKNQSMGAAQASPTNQNAGKGVTPSASPAPTVPSPKGQPAPPTKNSPVSAINEDRPRSIPSLRHKQMLAHLKGLKDKNDAIQSNIQKAINVIETKMVHILSTPGDSSSVEAFDDMEKEITNVLSMMKNQAEKQVEKPGKRKKSTGNHPDKIEEEFTTISDELFKKLDQILDSEMSRCSSIATPEPTDKLEDEGFNKKAADKNFLSLSMTTTTSFEETTDIRRKKPHRKGDKSRKFSAVPTKKPPKVEPVADCSGDQKKETISDSSAATKLEVPAAGSQKQSSSEDTNSKGDFVDDTNAIANAVCTLEHVNRSITIESDKDVLDTDPKTEDIVSLNKIDLELPLLLEFPQVPTHIPEVPNEEPETSKQIAEEILQNLLDTPCIKEIPKVLFEISNEIPHIPEHDVPAPIVRKEVIPEVPETPPSEVVQVAYQKGFENSYTVGRTWGLTPRVAHWIYITIIRDYGAIAYIPRVPQATSINKLYRVANWVTLF